jgi:hypothetical protein
MLQLDLNKIIQYLPDGVIILNEKKILSYFLIMKQEHYYFKNLIYKNKNLAKFRVLYVRTR